MPRLSVLMIRASLVYLAAGFVLGALMLADRGIPLGGWVYRLRPMHIEFLLLGWTVQLAFGVAFWILPRYRSGQERGREGLAWTAFGLLNAGVLGVAIGIAIGAPLIVGLLGRCAEGLAAAVFALHAWPRVKAFG
ncbi:MAG: hypothetical protein ACREL3_11190 [Gemmatimonadales bacterium]